MLLFVKVVCSIVKFLFKAENQSLSRGERVGGVRGRLPCFLWTLLGVVRHKDGRLWVRNFGFDIWKYQCFSIELNYLFFKGSNWLFLMLFFFFSIHERGSEPGNANRPVESQGPRGGSSPEKVHGKCLLVIFCLTSKYSVVIIFIFFVNFLS